MNSTPPKTLRDLRIGVVGVGYWGSKHLRVLRSLPEVATVIVVEERATGMPELQADLAAGTAFRSLAEALPHLDGVVLATPPTTHESLALQAIRAGKHVLVEKPLATSVLAARGLLNAAQEHGVQLMVGHTFEHNDAVKRLREVVQTGELGDLYYLDSARLNLGLYQRDVNVVMDLAPHDVSIANYVLDAEPTSVTAWGARHVHPILEDVAYLRLDYESVGVRANVHVSWLDPAKVRRTTAVGSRKMAVYNDLAAEERLRIYDKAVLRQAGGDGAVPGLSYHVGDTLSPRISFDEPLVVQDRHFARCVLDGSRPETDGERGLAVVKVLEAAQISIEEGRKVALAEVGPGQQLGRVFDVGIDLSGRAGRSAALIGAEAGNVAATAV